MTDISDAAVPEHTPPKHFVSFSGNGEDVILHRIFVGKPSGFYVDVGAAHPTFENDTKALYERGWTGINIEPNPSLFVELESGRPGDRNLQLALSDEDGTVDYWEVVGTGLSTCDAEEAQRAQKRGHQIRQTTVRCTTLARVLAEADVSAIDLLKIDVEGFELQVLRGNDWARYRPSVIVVEVTYPETPIRRPDRIRPLLEQHGYSFAYFDGLNDFFVRNGFAVAADSFRPTNVFDRVIHHTLISLREHAGNLERDRELKAEYNKSLREHIEKLEPEVESLQAVLSGVRGSLELLSGEALTLRSENKSLYAELSGLRTRSVREREEAAKAIETNHVQGERILALRRELEVAVGTGASLRQLVSERDKALRSTLAELSEVRTMLAATYVSKSWRITRPLRELSGLISRLRH